MIVVVFRPNIDTAKLRKYYTLYVVIQLLLIKCRLFELEVYICTTEEQLNKLKCIAEVLEKGSFNHMNTKNKIMKKKPYRPLLSDSRSENSMLHVNVQVYYKTCRTYFLKTRILLYFHRHL